MRVSAVKASKEKKLSLLKAVSVQNNPESLDLNSNVQLICVTVI